MIRDIAFSEVASDKLESTLICLEENFSKKAKWKFLKKLDACFKQIDKFPDSFKYSLIYKANKAIVTKHTSFYYRFTDKEIIVLYFVDNKMNNIFE